MFNAQKFIKIEIPAIGWFRCHRLPLKEWSVFLAATRDGARDKAYRETGSVVVRRLGRDSRNKIAYELSRRISPQPLRPVVWDAHKAAWTAVANKENPAMWQPSEDAARDAGLYVAAHTHTDATAQDIAHTESRMEVWRRGYGLLCDFDGTLIVYAGVGGNTN